jgi:hypothetical protein
MKHSYRNVQVVRQQVENGDTFICGCSTKSSGGSTYNSWYYTQNKWNFFITKNGEMEWSISSEEPKVKESFVFR